MIEPSDRSFLCSIHQGLAVATLLVGMALMAFAAGLALLGTTFALPIAVGFVKAWHRLQGVKAPGGAG